MSKRTISLALLTGFLIPLSFPLPNNLTIPGLAFIALVPLLFSLENKETSGKDALFLGLLSGTIAWLGTIYWVHYCMTIYANMSSILAFMVLLSLVIVMAFYIALFSWLYRAFLVELNIFLRIPLGALLFISLEYARTYFPFGGFPWALFGLSLYRFLPFIQVSEFGGIYAVSFLVVLLNLTVTAIFNKNVNLIARGVAGFIVFVLTITIFIWGKMRMKEIDEIFSSKAPVRVGVVQGNIDQDVKWSDEVFFDNLYTHIRLSEKLISEKIDLLIWPEASLTTYFNREWEKRSMIVNIISKFDCYFLFGSISKENSPEGKKNYFNSVFLLSPYAKSLLGRYDKIHLVPFGEYVPLPRLFFFADAIAGGATGNTTAGREVKVFSMGNIKIGSVICYEIIFPDLVRKFVKEGAQIMTTLTNDAWFGNSSAPYQHHSNMVFRAVENRAYFVRSANTGVSSIIDPCGRIVTQTKIFEATSFSGYVFPKDGLVTFYTKFGDIFVRLACGLTITFLVVILISRKIKNQGSLKIEK